MAAEEQSIGADRPNDGGRPGRHEETRSIFQSSKVSARAGQKGIK